MRRDSQQLIFLPSISPFQNYHPVSPCLFKSRRINFGTPRVPHDRWTAVQSFSPSGMRPTSGNTSWCLAGHSPRLKFDRLQSPLPVTRWTLLGHTIGTAALVTDRQITYCGCFLASRFRCFLLYSKMSTLSTYDFTLPYTLIVTAKSQCEKYRKSRQQTKHVAIVSEKTWSLSHELFGGEFTCTMQQTLKIWAISSGTAGVCVWIMLWLVALLNLTIGLVWVTTVQLRIKRLRSKFIFDKWSPTC